MLNKTITLFAPVLPIDEAETLELALEADREWRQKKCQELKSWIACRANIKQGSEGQYLQDRKALLDRLVGEQDPCASRQINDF